MRSKGTADGGRRDPAAQLDELRDLVLRRWEEIARAEMPAARQQDRPALIDTLPDVIDTIAEALRRATPEEVLRARGDSIGAEHGKKRAQAQEYSLEQVLDEYRIFRKVLFEALEGEAPLKPRDRNVLLQALELSVRNAAREFSRRRSSEQEKAAANLARVNRQLEAAVRERSAQLSKSEVRFRHLVEGVKDYAIFTVDPGGHITSWNKGAERMKGYPVEEIIGTHFSILYPEDGKRRDEPTAHLRAAAIEGRFRGEGLRVRKNGDLFTADVCITPMFEGGELAGFSKVVQDMTERNLLMQERDLSRGDAHLLKIEAEDRERFVATLTHDLRSPLSAAAAAAELIARAPEDHDKVRDLAGRVSRAVQRSDKMISDLLDAARIQAGGLLPLRFEPCDVKDIAQELCDDLTTQHGRRFQLRVEGASDGTWSVDGLRRLLDNLLSNALKYSDPGTPILVRLARVEDREHISVHNQGTIIPREQQAQLFTPFHRTPSAAASGKRGWGLGLTLVKGIVDAHGGMVKVESYLKEGTTFTVDLPVDATSHRPGLPDSAS